MAHQKCCNYSLSFTQQRTHWEQFEVQSLAPRQYAEWRIGPPEEWMTCSCISKKAEHGVGQLLISCLMPCCCYDTFMMFSEQVGKTNIPRL